MTKIATQKTFNYGRVSIGLQIPPVFVSDNNIKLKDEFDIYRDEYNGQDALIIVPKINGNVQPKKEKRNGIFRNK